MTAMNALTTKLIYRADALASAGLGLLLLVAPGQVAGVLGGALAPGILVWVGAFLLPWAAFNGAIGFAPRLPRGQATGNLVGDTLWVLASLAIIAIASAQFTQVGLILFTALTAGVAVIALIKLAGLRRSAA